MLVVAGALVPPALLTASLLMRPPLLRRSVTGMQYEQGYGDAAQQGPGAPQANGRQGYGYQPDYGAEQPGYGQQQGYSAQQSYCEQVVWSVGKGAGVTGLVDSQTALRDITTQQSVYMQDVRLLPHILRGGEALVLSRWNMQRPKPTVSREQCKVVVAADGTAALISCGRGALAIAPTQTLTLTLTLAIAPTLTLPLTLTLALILTLTLTLTLILTFIPYPYPTPTPN